MRMAIQGRANVRRPEGPAAAGAIAGACLTASGLPPYIADSVTSAVAHSEAPSARLGAE